MALKPKSATFQVRIDPELLARFQVLCDSHGLSLSHYVRRMIAGAVDQDDKRRLDADRRARYEQAQLKRLSGE